MPRYGTVSVDRCIRPYEPEGFWRRVKKSPDPDGCWEWTGRRTPSGYGIMRGPDGHAVMAHRRSWELTRGPIPEGLLGCHHCDNPPCVRPDHLFLGTSGDNYRDALKKGRLVRAIPSDVCKKGHARTEDNLTPTRNCLTCKRAERRPRVCKSKTPGYCMRANCVDKIGATRLCKRGHLLAPENVRPPGWGCRQCATEAAREKRAPHECSPSAAECRWTKCPARKTVVRSCRAGHSLAPDNRLRSGRCKTCRAIKERALYRQRIAL